jgi:hypothetical protein
VQWNGTNLPTSYAFNNSSGEFLTATVAASLLTGSGTASITVNNPSATRPISNSLPVHIINPQPPTLTSLSTTLVPTGAVQRSRSMARPSTASTVSFNEDNLPITYVSSTQASVTIPASALVALGVDFSQDQQRRGYQLAALCHRLCCNPPQQHDLQPCEWALLSVDAERAGRRMEILLSRSTP